jgi:predicted N-acetyltransferase YhbS
MITMGYEASTDIVAIEALLDQEFGPDRHGKTCQRLRDGQVPAANLALVLRRESEQGSLVVGTLRFWDILVGQKTRALLLGPLAVDHSLQGTGLNLAAAGQHGAVILVGDEPYYRRFGFRGDLTQGMDLPGPVDRARFLALELKEGALASASGMISPLQVPFAETLRRPVADVFGGIFA